MLPRKGSLVLVMPWVFMVDTETSRALLRMLPLLARVTHVEWLEEDGEWIPILLAQYNRIEYTVDGREVTVVTEGDKE